LSSSTEEHTPAVDDEVAEDEVVDGEVVDGEVADGEVADADAAVDDGSSFWEHPAVVPPTSAARRQAARTRCMS
jgi:hypothetical protein